MSSDAIYEELDELGADMLGSFSVAPVKKAFEQIADQLRELILAGRLKPGTRLPAEQGLASQFGVSRATIRESLRVLATEGLVRTTRGARGGSFVSQPTIQDIERFLHTNIGLLSRSQEVSLNEFLEARELFEVPAARFAAARCSQESLDRLVSAIPEDLNRGVSELFVSNREFHATIVDICSNTLLSLAAEPIFVVLQTHLVRSQLDATFQSSVAEHHRAIAQAIKAGDEEEAARTMRDHLRWLRPIYEQSWLYR